MFSDCLPGTYGSNCDPCPAGSWCPGSSPGNTTFAPITRCDSNQGSPVRAADPSQCYSLPGYGGENCTVCGEGKYSAGLSLEQCKACPLGQTTNALGSTSQDDCVCPPGFGSTSFNPLVCVVCPQNYYGQGGSKNGCAPCSQDGSMKTTGPGATRFSECLCMPG